MGNPFWTYIREGTQASRPLAARSLTGKFYHGSDTNELSLCLPDAAGTMTWYAVPLTASGQVPMLKAPVRAAILSPAAYTYTSSTKSIEANANGSINPVDTGVTLIAGDRFLVLDGTAQAGVWQLVSAGSAGSHWSAVRPSDFDEDAKVRSGCLVPVTEGTAYGDHLFQLQTNDPITLDSTVLTFAVPVLTASSESSHTHGATGLTASDSGHTHGATGLTCSFAGSALVQRGSVTYLRVRADATDVAAGTAKGAAQPIVPAAAVQPDCPRNVQVSTGGGWTSTDTVDVTVTGTVRGTSSETEVITVPAAGTTTVGSRAFEEITGITWTTPAGWTAGTFDLELGSKLGLLLPYTFSNLGITTLTEWDETGVPPAPVQEAVSATNATEGTVTPTTAPNDDHSYRITYRFSTTPAGSNTVAGSTASGTASVSVGGSTAAGSSHTHSIS